MSGIPLHPILVHLPLVLALALPLAILAALAAGFRTGNARKYWPIVAALHVILVFSAFVAVQSGEQDEEKVEKVLASEDPLKEHEERGETFFKVAAGALILTAAGFAPGAVGTAGRALGGLASLGVLALGLLTGHSGGRLVYTHGAAAAYSTGAPQAPGAASAKGGEGGEGAAAGEKEKGGSEDRDADGD
jgi:uncharacterized membrane protein